MTSVLIFQVVLYFTVLFFLAWPLGIYIARIYEGQSVGLNTLLKPVEYAFYRYAGIHPEQSMGWKTYLSAMLCLNFLGILVLYGIQRAQYYLPLNPQGFSGVSPDLAFNTAVSFATNTDWQAYVGEASLSYLTQMLGLTVQNFISAASGMAILMAFIRGLVCRESSDLGNFWVDLFRGIFYILLPLSLLLSVVLVSQGVIQNLKPYETVQLPHPIVTSSSNNLNQDGTPPSSITQQILPMGPVASQVAIKQLGSNGGGFFNANAAHPFENATPLTNFLEMLALLLIPVALCHTFGYLVGDKRQGLALLIAMAIMLIPLMGIAIVAEQQGNPAFTAMQIDATPHYGLYPAGNMEGKETRFGIISSTIWAVATTTTSNGSVNAMMDSMMPLGGMIPLWMMQLGEVVFGGVGSGLLGMLMMVIMAVFVAGLMVGRTPEYLGKKIEPYEMKMAAVAVLVMPLSVLFCAAFSVVSEAGIHSVGNPGAHGLTEVLYAVTSMVNNNGSAMSGLQVNTPFYNVMGAIGMLVGRYWIAIPVLAIAGSLVQKKQIPSSSGTLSTYTPFFIALLIGVTLIIGALSFLPSLALGPLVEHLIIWEQYGH